MSKQTKSRGFTIVELLIVIVVIAILAAITIVAYNGIQKRATATSSKESASQLKNKIEAWNSIKGAYPTASDMTGGLTADDAKEAKIDDALSKKIIVTKSDKDHTVAYTACGTTPTGYKITWWNGDADTGTLTPPETMVVGTGC